MRRLSLVVLVMLLGGARVGLAQSAWDPTTYNITLTSTADQEAILEIRFHEECTRAISSATALPPGCTQLPPPDQQRCECLPTVPQKRNFIVQEYLADGFVADKRRIYGTYGRDLANIYPTLSKPDRDGIDTIVGRPLLP